MKKHLRSADVRRALAADSMTAVEIAEWLRMPVDDVMSALGYLRRTMQVRMCVPISERLYELTDKGFSML